MGCGDSKVAESSTDKKKVIFVLGGPGSGKGTQCEKIVHKYGCKHLSAGDLLRDAVKTGHAKAPAIEDCMKEGKLVTSDIIVTLLSEAVAQGDKKYYLVDGFPRNEENLQAWEREVKGKVDVAFVLFFECSEETMEKRIMKRGETSGRSDDNAVAIKKRFKTYTEQTLPVIEKYKSHQLLVSINANNDVDKVWQDTQAALDVKIQK